MSIQKNVQANSVIAAQKPSDFRPGSSLVRYDIAW